MSCCAPSSGPREESRGQGGDAEGRDAAGAGTEVGAAVLATPWRAVPGGPVRIGSEDPFGYPEDGESPVRTVDLAPVELSAVTVTNADWAAFVAATGHRSLAERSGWSYVVAGFVADPERWPAVAAAPWWLRVDGATWATPEGPGSDVEDRADHPVVHVSHGDATAFARWAGARLPTEVEWEAAARGGLDQATFPWGEELTPGGEHRMNVWQGSFPEVNAGEDGWIGTCPVRSYEANGYGLHCVTGNVWEWTASGDDQAVVTKGGSYLCHASYCRRYRPAARQLLAPGSTTGNLGVRLAR